MCVARAELPASASAAAAAAAAVSAASAAAAAAAVAITAAAAAAAAIAVAAAAAAGSAAFFSRPCFVYYYFAFADFSLIEGCDRCLGFLFRSHFDEAETLASACRAVSNDQRALHRTVLREQLLKIGARYREVKVSYIQFPAHPNISFDVV
jgi:hypothetical protein